jgi:hypothetical protein
MKATTARPAAPAPTKLPLLAAPVHVATAGAVVVELCLTDDELATVVAATGVAEVVQTAHVDERATDVEDLTVVEETLTAAGLVVVLVVHSPQLDEAAVVEDEDLAVVVETLTEAELVEVHSSQLEEAAVVVDETTTFGAVVVVAGTVVVEEVHDSQSLVATATPAMRTEAAMTDFILIVGGLFVCWNERLGVSWIIRYNEE